jgi:hypothetical protein
VGAGGLRSPGAIRDVMLGVALSVVLAQAAPGPADAPRAIVGGMPADVGAFGAVVALAWDGEVHCTGTRIDASHVLTAGHCAPATEVGAVDPAIGDASTERLAWAPVVRVDPWAEGDPRDLALIRVDGLPDGATMPLLARDEADGLVSGAALWVAGFGAIDASGRVPAEGLRVGDVVLDDASCDAPARGCNAAVPSEVEWITGGPADACFGDSGGPVGLWRDGRAVQAAVTSRGVLGASSACGGGGIATRVDGLSRWLRRQGAQPEWVGDARGCAIAPQRGPAWAVGFALLAGWRRRRRAVAAACIGVLAGCTVPDGRALGLETADTGETDADGVRSLPDVLAAAPSYGATVTIGPLRVTTAASPVDRSVLLHDPVAGVGLAVLPSVRAPAWPPAVGQTVEVTVVWVGTAADPQGYLASESAFEVGEPATWADDPDLSGVGPYRVVSAGLRVASWPDPTGRADAVAADGTLGRLVDRWAVGLPPAGSEGTARFVRWPDGSWTPLTAPPAAPAPTPRAVALADVLSGGVPDGETVTVEAVQQAPWSADRRWTAIADGEVGVWVDAEGFGRGVGQAGDRGVWQGEVRTLDGVRTLRTWWDRVFLDVVAVTPAAEVADGRLGVRRVVDLGPVDLAGERLDADGVIWDPRFADVQALADGTDVLGVWWVRPDDVRFAPLP